MGATTAAMEAVMEVRALTSTEDMRLHNNHNTLLGHLLVLLGVLGMVRLGGIKAVTMVGLMVVMEVQEDPVATVITAQAAADGRTFSRPHLALLR